MATSKAQQFLIFIQEEYGDVDAHYAHYSDPANQKKSRGLLKFNVGALTGAAGVLAAGHALSHKYPGAAGHVRTAIQTGKDWAEKK